MTRIRYNRTYPAAPATFKIVPPMAGLTQQQVDRLLKHIKELAKEKAKEKVVMIFDVRLTLLVFSRRINLTRLV
jgi:hypothetical protein